MPGCRQGGLGRWSWLSTPRSDPAGGGRHLALNGQLSPVSKLFTDLISSSEQTLNTPPRSPTLTSTSFPARPRPIPSPSPIPSPPELPPRLTPTPLLVHLPMPPFLPLHPQSPQTPTTLPPVQPSLTSRNRPSSPASSTRSTWIRTSCSTPRYLRGCLLLHLPSCRARRTVGSENGSGTRSGA